MNVKEKIEERKKAIHQIIKEFEPIELHYAEENSNDVKYSDLSEKELQSLLIEKKEELLIAIHFAERNNNSLKIEWINYIIIIAGILASLSAIILPLFNVIKIDFYTYVASFGIVIMFLLCYWLIGKHAEIEDKIKIIKQKKAKLFEARELVKYVQKISDPKFQEI